jgi:hypothetical protein
MPINIKKKVRRVQKMLSPGFDTLTVQPLVIRHCEYLRQEGTDKHLEFRLRFVSVCCLDTW